MPTRPTPVGLTRREFGYPTETIEPAVALARQNQKWVRKIRLIVVLYSDPAGFELESGHTHEKPSGLALFVSDSEELVQSALGRGGVGRAAVFPAFLGKSGDRSRGRTEGISLGRLFLSHSKSEGTGFFPPDLRKPRGFGYRLLRRRRSLVEIVSQGQQQEGRTACVPGGSVDSRRYRKGRLIANGGVDGAFWRDGPNAAVR
jgi:hypothetical protein